MFKRWIQAFIFAGIVYCPSAVQAATYNSKVFNGSTCYGYAPFDTSVAFPYQHTLYGYKGSAFCNLDFTDDWQVQNLSYVLFSGNAGGGPVHVRLCVHSGDAIATCSAQVSVSSTFVNWVAPPSLPPYATGAFLQFDFPGNGWTRIYDVIPAWVKY